MLIAAMPESQKCARLIAYYLPQYYPNPENNKWWGEGFTDWFNVTRAKALFRGHYQPHLPADLGFYDLRLPETRQAQAQMARQFGIEGFCYWHYWYAGRRLLARPFEEMLRTGEPDFPFCLSWANHAWTNVWDGSAPQKVLVPQTYPGVEDHKNHFRYLLPAFKDRRYIKVDGKPIFLINLPFDIPDQKRFTDLWRELALAAGLEGLYLIGVHLQPDQVEKLGFDGTVFWGNRLARKYGVYSLGVLSRCMRRIRRQPEVYQYQKILPYLLRAEKLAANEHICVIPNWDSTPRFGQRGLVFRDSTPELFQRHLREALRRIVTKPPQERLVFVKSWNEWGEGNHLEPDQKYGKAYLEALLNEVSCFKG